MAKKLDTDDLLRRLRAAMSGEPEAETSAPLPQRPSVQRTVQLPNTKPVQVAQQIVQPFNTKPVQQAMITPVEPALLPKPADEPDIVLVQYKSVEEAIDALAKLQRRVEANRADVVLEALQEFNVRNKDDTGTREKITKNQRPLTKQKEATANFSQKVKNAVKSLVLKVEAPCMLMTKRKDGVPRVNRTLSYSLFIPGSKDNVLNSTICFDVDEVEEYIGQQTKIEVEKKAQKLKRPLSPEEMEQTTIDMFCYDELCALFGANTSGVIIPKTMSEEFKTHVRTFDILGGGIQALNNDRIFQMVFEYFHNFLGTHAASGKDASGGTFWKYTTTFLRKLTITAAHIYQFIAQNPLYLSIILMISKAIRVMICLAFSTHFTGAHALEVVSTLLTEVFAPYPMLMLLKNVLLEAMKCFWKSVSSVGGITLAITSIAVVGGPVGMILNCIAEVTNGIDHIITAGNVLFRVLAPFLQYMKGGSEASKFGLQQDTNIAFNLVDAMARAYVNPELVALESQDLRRDRLSFASFGLVTDSWSNKSADQKLAHFDLARRSALRTGLSQLFMSTTFWRGLLFWLMSVVPVPKLSSWFAKTFPELTKRIETKTGYRLETFDPLVLLQVFMRYATAWQTLMGALDEIYEWVVDVGGCVWTYVVRRVRQLLNYLGAGVNLAEDHDEYFRPYDAEKPDLLTECCMGNLIREIQAQILVNWPRKNKAYHDVAGRRDAGYVSERALRAEALKRDSENVAADVEADEDAMPQLVSNVRLSDATAKAEGPSGGIMSAIFNMFGYGTQPTGSQLATEQNSTLPRNVTDFQNVGFHNTTRR